MRNLVSVYVEHSISQGNTERYVAWSSFKVHKFLDFIDADPARITRRDVQAFLDGLPHRRSTVDGYWRAIRGFLNWCSESGHIQPVRFRVRQRPDPPRPSASMEHVRAILDGMTATTEAQRRDRALFATLYFTGARLREALTLESRNCDLADKHATIYASKTNRWRVVPIVEPLHAILGPWLAEMQGRYVFPAFWPSYRDSPMSNKSAFDRWHAIQSEAGIPREKHLRIHDLRHAFSCHAHSRGIDVLDLQQILGHSAISTTQKYARVDPAAARARLENVWR